MTLGQIVQRLDLLPGSRADRSRLPAELLDRTVTGVAYDSRAVKKGQIFVALRGRRADGTTFVEEAINRGALAIVAETAAGSAQAAAWLRVADARLALAALAAAFYRDPSEQMTVVGITGTNGKTTTSYLISAMFEKAGIPCGRLGTVSYRIGQREREASRTTPEAPDVQALLREMVESGCGACAMEVSSHALALRRVDQMRFAAAVFTNLTRDHLDFHGDMETYFLAKRRLFEMLPATSVGIINIDDPRGTSLVEACRRAVTYAVERPADVMPGPVSFSLQALAFDVQTPRGSLHIRSRLLGHFNLYNILSAVATGVALDLPPSGIEQGVADLENVPGRFQVVSRPTDEIAVVVDYAHTDDALKNLLETARPLAKGRLITVFGCGGDRDRTKRPLMGAVAARLSDVVIVTSDNPRSEDPARIIEEIQRGIVPPSARAAGRPESAKPIHMAVIDRRDAIQRAVRLARPGDLVLVAGKGHEKYQEIGGRVLPFDDVAVAREALARRSISAV